MSDPLVKDFTLRRIDLWAQVVRLCGASLLRYHRVVAEGVENLPQEGAGLLLPKHHAYRDILVEGVSLYKHTSRFATFVMNSGLWGILELSGGVKVTRPKDVRRLKIANSAARLFSVLAKPIKNCRPICLGYIGMENS